MGDYQDDLGFWLKFENNEAPSLAVLAQFAPALSRMLDEYAAEYVNNADIHWNLTTLGVSSLRVSVDAFVDIEIRPQLRLVKTQLTRDLALVEGGRSPEDIAPGEAAPSMRSIIRLFRSQHVESIEVRAGPEVTVLTKEGAGAEVTNAPKLRRSLGSVRGVVRTLSFAQGTPYFSILPDGGTRSVKCYFPADEDLIEEVKAVLRYRAIVTGIVVRAVEGDIVKVLRARRVRRLESAKQPVAVHEVFGALSDMTEGLPSDEWVRSQREGD